MKKLISNITWYAWRMKRFYVFIIIFSMLFSSVPILAGEAGQIQIFDAPVELATLDAPWDWYTFRMLPVADFEEAVTRLPQYATITTSPPTQRDPLPVIWEERPFPLPPFNPTPGVLNFIGWSVHLPSDVLNSAGIFTFGTVAIQIFESEFAASQAAAQNAVGVLPMSNSTTAQDIISAVITAINDPSIEVEWYEDFNLTPATPRERGEITGTLRLTLGAKHLDVTISRTITHPFANAPQINDVRQTVNNLHISNATTADDFLAAAETAVIGSDIEISIIDFSLVPATETLWGRINGTVRLTYDGEFIDISINRQIPFLLPWFIIIQQVTWIADELVVSNETTFADVVAHIEPLRSAFGIEITWHDDFSLTPATENRTGKITTTATISRGGVGGNASSLIISRSIPRTRIAIKSFLEWNYATIAAPRPGNQWPATMGVGVEYTYPHTNLAMYYADGVRAILGFPPGHPHGDRLAINAPNRGGNFQDWFDVNVFGDNIDEAAGWVITFPTIGWENINFSAKQASSGNGPGGFGLAYRIGTAGNWTRYGDNSWPLVSVRTAYPRDTALGATFNNVPLPDEINNHPVVQIKLYLTREVRLGGEWLRHNEGNTSINNIIFRGERITGIQCAYCEDSGDCCEHCNPCVCHEIFTVDFDPSPGFFTATPPSLTFTSGASIGILPRATEMSNPGFRFMGWFENERSRWRDNFKVTSPLTLIAMWEPIPDPAGFRVGDVDGDGRVTSADATMLARWIITHRNDRPTALPNFCRLAADIDGDGEVTINDLTLLARWLVGHNVNHLIAH